MSSVYIADPDEENTKRVQQYFAIHGYSTEGFSALTDISKAVKKIPPDILITELDFPDGDGFQFLRSVRSHYAFPVVIASFRNSESDRIMSFELGCDDYVAKPYSIKELTLRVSALLRSGRKHSSPVQCWALNSSKLVIDRGSHVARLDGREIHFTASEWKVLTFLAFRAGSLVSRMQLLQLCFPESLESYDRVIDTHVKNIRAKLGATGSEWIETVRGYGYRFRGTPEIL